MMIWRLLFLFFLLTQITLSDCAFATDESMNTSALSKEICVNLQQALDKGGTSVSYALVQGGNLLIADAVGYLDATRNAAATVDTLYNIGSLSKLYTAAAVMKLVDEGRIGLDDLVVTHLPDFKLKDSRYPDITVRMLLNHSSGILGTDYTIGITYGGYDSGYYDKLRLYFAKSFLKANPGMFSVYCNDGFEVAELLINKVSGIPFDRYVAENFLKPLKLLSTGYATRTFAPGSYAVKGSFPQEFPNVMASGGVSTNPVDLARFGTMFLNRGAGVLKPASVSEMSRAQGKTFIVEDTASTKFGLGWDTVNPFFENFDFGSGTLVKSGGTSQFISHLYVIPAYNLSASISVTSDFSGDASAVLRDIIAKVLRTQGIETARLPKKHIPLQPEPIPDGFAKEYTGYYGSGYSLMKVEVNSSDQTINLLLLDNDAWSPKFASLGYDGQFFGKTNGEKICRFVQANGNRYLLLIDEQQNIVFPAAQKLESTTARLGAWEGRLNQLYLPAEVYYNAVFLMPGLKLVRQEGLEGLVLMQQGGRIMPLSVVDDLNTSINLSIGRDLSTLTVEEVKEEEWLANEAYTLRPVSSLTELASGTIVLPEDGANRLHRIPTGNLSFTISEKGRIIAYNQSGDQVYDSLIQGLDFSLLPKDGFIRFVGLPGAQFKATIDTEEKHKQ